MQLGKFSVSLNVKDLKVAKSFYESLGFKKIFGGEEQGFVIMDNDGVTIGLFQGMFEQNILTFNPGWDKGGNPLNEFIDVRTIQSDLKKKNVSFVQEADETTTGPASFMITDPDGNTILFDQHV